MVPGYEAKARSPPSVFLIEQPRTPGSEKSTEPLQPPNTRDIWTGASRHGRTSKSVRLLFWDGIAAYLYTQSIFGSSADEPLIQPMYWSYPHINEAYEVPNQYFLGRDLLVAPIVQPRDRRTGLASVRAWLPPKGRFVDLFSGTVYDGGRGVTFYRSIEQYPVLVSEGSIITLDGDAVPRNGCLNPDVLEIIVVVGQDGEATLIETIEDNTFNGASNPQRDLKQREISIKFQQQKGELAILGMQRLCIVRFFGLDSIPADLNIAILGDNDADISVSKFGDSAPCLSVDIPASKPDVDSVINLVQNPQLAVQDHTSALEELIRGYQIEFGLKDRLWNAIEQGKGQPLKIISSLLSLGCDDAVVGPLVELVSADGRS